MSKEKDPVVEKLLKAATDIIDSCNKENLEKADNLKKISQKLFNAAVKIEIASNLLENDMEMCNIWDFESVEKKKKKKKRSRKFPDDGFTCALCAATETCMKRTIQDVDGNKLRVCNKCGLKAARIATKKKKSNGKKKKEEKKEEEKKRKGKEEGEKEKKEEDELIVDD